MSLPSRECGLKYLSYLLCFILWPSLPSRECGLKFQNLFPSRLGWTVTPFAGVWIEIRETCLCFTAVSVTPFAGVWIEIISIIALWYTALSHSLRGSVDWNACDFVWLHFLTPSLPSRECGLKWSLYILVLVFVFVTPFAGVWIEIQQKKRVLEHCGSLPSRECGLKWYLTAIYHWCYLVTPFAGVWIEISAGTAYVCEKWVTPFAGVWIEIT